MYNMPSLTFYHSGLDSTATADALTLPAFTPETPEYDFAVTLPVEKANLNLFSYTLNNENWDEEDPDEQDISITFPNYATSAFSNLLEQGEFTVDYTSGNNPVISAILTAFNDSNAYGIALLHVFAQHYGSYKVFSLFTGENHAKSALRTDINDAIGATVTANAGDLASPASFIIGNNTTHNNAITTLLNMIQNAPSRMDRFKTSTTVGLSELLEVDDEIQFVVTIFENALQNNLDGTTPTTQQKSRILVKIKVIADAVV